MTQHKQLNILELGSYIAPAYAGMILAEQNHTVTKWTRNDPIHDLLHGEDLWQWINHKKTVLDTHANNVALLQPNQYDIILDNTRLSTWHKRGIDPTKLAKHLNVTWVALTPNANTYSFDIIAQAQAFGNLGILPFYIGDTAAGLWLAFKALAAQPGYHQVGHATCLAKLVEGEETLQRPPNKYPYDPDDSYTCNGQTAQVTFKNTTITEPMRDREWRLQNLPNRDGRFIV